MEKQIAKIQTVFQAYESKSIKADNGLIKLRLDGHVYGHDLAKISDLGFKYLKRSGTGVTLVFKIIQDA